MRIKSTTQGNKKEGICFWLKKDRLWVILNVGL